MRRSGRGIGRAGTVDSGEPVPQPGGRRPQVWSRISSRARNRAPRIELGERVGLRPNDCSLPIEWLSGGNQQKVVVGRWLHLNGKVYVFEDPTAGVDVGAKAEIYRLFDVVLKGGATILIVSTDFEEVAKVCHRALVFDRGRVVAELSGDDLCAENLLAAASASVGQRASGHLMQSLGSNALEPTRSELAALSRGQAIVRVLPVYGLPILTVLLIVLFSLLLPESFPTAINARSILSDKAIIALLSLAAMVPMMAGRIDLTIGFGIVMWHILAISLQVQYSFPWPLACLVVVLCAGVAGLINGLLVEVAQIDSFIATLGTGTILYALALWHTEGRQVIGDAASGLHRDQRDVDPRRADAGRLCAGAGGGALDRRPSGCRSAATSTRSAPTRRRRRSTAFRFARTSSACSSRPG